MNDGIGCAHMLATSERLLCEALPGTGVVLCGNTLIWFGMAWYKGMPLWYSLGWSVLAWSGVLWYCGMACGMACYSMAWYGGMAWWYSLV